MGSFHVKEYRIFKFVGKMMKTVAKQIKSAATSVRKKTAFGHGSFWPHKISHFKSSCTPATYFYFPAILIISSRNNSTQSYGAQFIEKAEILNAV